MLEMIACNEDSSFGSVAVVQQGVEGSPELVAAGQVHQEVGRIADKSRDASQFDQKLLSGRRCSVMSLQKGVAYSSQEERTSVERQIRCRHCHQHEGEMLLRLSFSWRRLKSEHNHSCSLHVDFYPQWLCNGTLFLLFARLRRVRMKMRLDVRMRESSRRWLPLRK